MTDNKSNETNLRQLFNCVSKALNLNNEEEIPSACPHKKRRRRRKKEPKKVEPEKFEDSIDIGPPCKSKDCEMPQRRIFPKVYCYIKRQDPYAICCCNPKPELPPCPPKLRQPRRSICDCDLCKKHMDRKCCRPIFRGRISGSRYFEQA